MAESTACSRPFRTVPVSWDGFDADVGRPFQASFRSFRLSQPFQASPASRVADRLPTAPQLPSTSSPKARSIGISVVNTKERAVTDIDAFVERYIGIWNEPDGEARRRIVRTLWQEDARHLARTIEAVGHAGIEERVASAYEKWVKEKGNIFRLRDGVDGHHGTIKLRWEMLPADGGDVISIGFDFLVLGKDGRIRTGYQFIEA
jgi:hypothetical protein